MFIQDNNPNYTARILSKMTRHMIIFTINGLGTTYNEFRFKKQFTLKFKYLAR